MKENIFYITTTLPYVNSDPHLGFAAEIVHADILARFAALQGKEVVFNTGTDEHGLKIFRNAEEKGMGVQSYVDEHAARFEQLKTVLNLSYTHFIRTTNPAHKLAAQAFWNRCLEKGDIYKKTYQVKYCVGCELEKTDSELVEGRCPLHPNKEIELIDEENYFFAFSKYQQPLLDLYAKRSDFVVPEFRFHEIISFVKQGLQDFSISRLKEKMPWGVAVPGDDAQVMYVWFDALINYISTVGWPENTAQFEKFWPGIQIAGKDNLRQQSAMWQAMLLSAGLPNSEQIIIRGFISVDGQKMSKSVGNVINPVDVVEKYGTDALRYYIAHDLNPFEDSDFTFEKFEESYTAGLVNGLGNTVARIFTMAMNYEVAMPERVSLTEEENKLAEILATRNIQLATQFVWEQLQNLDVFIQQTQPFKVIKIDPEKAKADVAVALERLSVVARMLRAFLPEASEKIQSFFAKPDKENIPKLFPRLI